MDELNLESLAVFGFACIIAYKLLSFFLNVVARRLDCIKDTLIALASRLDQIERKLDGRD